MQVISSATPLAMKDSILQAVYWTALLAVTTPLLVIFFLWYNTPKLQTSIPWVGLRGELFSVTRACMREWTAGLKTASEGYNKESLEHAPQIA